MSVGECAGVRGFGRYPFAKHGLRMRSGMRSDAGCATTDRSGAGGADWPPQALAKSERVVQLPWMPGVRTPLWSAAGSPMTLSPRVAGVACRAPRSAIGLRRRRRARELEWSGVVRSRGNLAPGAPTCGVSANSGNGWFIGTFTEALSRSITYVEHVICYVYQVCQAALQHSV